jgi:hypothetical protein
MIGSGAIETQTMGAKTVLPQSQVIVGDKTSDVSTSSNGTETETPATGVNANASSGTKNSGTTLASLPGLQTVLLSLVFALAISVAV